MINLSEIASSLGLDQIAWIPLKKPITLEFYQEWLDAGLHADMDYLREHLSRKAQPSELLPRARSAVVVTCSYVPHPRPAGDRAARVALYAQGEDYHLWFKEKLEAICSLLRSQYPDENFLAMTDSRPVMERDLAYQAGLGWFGKNNCLIHPRKGSLFFIGEIYSTAVAFASESSATNLVPAEISPLPDFCGTCTRCIDICPTGALEKHRLDSAKCISYLTIESKAAPPVELRKGIGDWFFGCDLCQTVCPWNQKVIRAQEPSERFSTNSILNDSDPSREALVSDLRYFLTTSGKQLERDLACSPLLRARPRGLKRNAMIVAANRGLFELHPEITAFLDSDLSELAHWCLNQFDI